MPSDLMGSLPHTPSGSPFVAGVLDRRRIPGLRPSVRTVLSYLQCSRQEKDPQPSPVH